VQPLVDLVSLRCFTEAARLGNFRSAAAACHLSPTAFSDRIRRLEEDLKCVLFERTTRSIRLTDAGQRLLSQARDVLDRASALHAVADGRAPQQTLTLGTRYELGMSWLVPGLGALEAARPGRHLHLRFGSSDDLLQATRRGEIDAVVTSARLAGGGLEFAPLHEEHYCFVASPALLRTAALSNSEDARRHTLFDIDDDLPLFGYLLDAVGARRTWDFARIQHLGTIAAIRYRVLEGAGVAVLPAYFVKEDLARKRLRRLLPRAPLRSDCFRLVWKRDHAHTAELRQLADELASRPLR
jgi:LysR family transcriptional regulator, glycine cleavage system transcriptional activator